MTIKGRTVGFVGAGNMGEALIKGLVGANLIPAEAIHATDVRAERLKELDRQYGIQVSSDNAELVRRADIVILAVKPQIMDAVLREIAPVVTRRKLLISIAAGVSTARIRALLSKDTRLIRVMPNTPALVLEGVTAIAKADGLEADDLDTAAEIFSAVGRVVVLGEELIDAVTGLSGSGPAYVALVIESLADGGVRMGLDRVTAMTLATQTVLGAAKLLLETGVHPGALKDMVSSPGGTTIAGVAALEEGGIRATFIKAVERATQRSRELGQGSRGCSSSTTSSSRWRTSSTWPSSRTSGSSSRGRSSRG
jgi:pyrroline-5-carboxylate reductase